MWYLAADHRGEPRLFRADRALSATVLDEPARRRGGVELAGVWDTLRRGIDDIPAPLPVTVSVRREIVGKFLRIHEADLAEPSGAGSLPEAGSDPGRVIVNLRFRSVGAAEALLAFGSDAEVLAPAELRQARRPAEAPGQTSTSWMGSPRRWDQRHTALMSSPSRVSARNVNSRPPMPSGLNSSTGPSSARFPEVRAYRSARVVTATHAPGCP